MHLTREDVDPRLHEVREAMTHVQVLHDLRLVRFAGRAHVVRQGPGGQLARVTEVVEETEQPQHPHPFGLIRARPCLTYRYSIDFHRDSMEG